VVADRTTHLISSGPTTLSCTWWCSTCLSPLSFRTSIKCIKKAKPAKGGSSISRMYEEGCRVPSRCVVFLTFYTHSGDLRCAQDIGAVHSIDTTCVLPHWVVCFPLILILTGRVTGFCVIKCCRRPFVESPELKLLLDEWENERQFAVRACV
jgi:hypothetical protein